MSGRPGVGVMLQMLAGTRGGPVFAAACGKIITDIELQEEDDRLYIALEDGSAIMLSDEGQSCCEHRYMRTDDDLDHHVGAKLIGAEIREAPGVENDYEVHEMEFLVITTSRGSFTMANHNEHNGYYGGFWIQVREVEPPEPVQ